MATLCGVEPDGLEAAERVDELEPGERRRCPATAGQRPEPLGVAERRRRGDWPRDQREQAGDRPRDRPPRVERPEDVAEQRRGDDQAQPEGREDERDREVAVGRLGALEARVDDERPGGRRRTTPARPAVTRLTTTRESPSEQRPPAVLLEAAASRQASVSATNETIRTSDAPQANSHSGIGRSCLPTSGGVRARLRPGRRAPPWRRPQARPPPRREADSRRGPDAISRARP